MAGIFTTPKIGSVASTPRSSSASRAPSVERSGDVEAIDDDEEEEEDDNDDAWQNTNFSSRRTGTGDDDDERLFTHPTVIKAQKRRLKQQKAKTAAGKNTVKRQKLVEATTKSDAQGSGQGRGGRG